MSRPTETELIARFFAPIAGPGGLGLTDDAACLAPSPGHDLVVTVDALVEGGHFLPDDPPRTLGWKALAVNVSDLAAKGANPRGFLLALALPANWTEAWLEAFAAGLGEAAALWNCPLLGGDTVRAASVLTLSVTAFGEVPAGAMVRRSGARAGDAICVTGTIGDAALGLAVRRGGEGLGSPSGDAAFFEDRYRRPQPRIALADLVRRYATAAMDVSDGLAGDLAKLLRTSEATGRVRTDAVPLSDAAKRLLKRHPDLIDRIVTGGDDYEILLTVRPADLEHLVRQAAERGIPVSPIGTVEAGSGLPLFQSPRGERRYEAGSFSHF